MIANFQKIEEENKKQLEKKNQEESKIQGQQNILRVVKGTN